MNPILPVVLTIAGSDCGGNAGVQADLRSFHALGAHGCTAFAALTAQNPFAVRGILPVPGDFIRLQLETIFDAYSVGGIKTGMLSDAATISVVADFLSNHRGIPLVVDPVMVATSGAKLLADDAIETMTSRLFPLAALITPNQPEAEVLTGIPIHGIESARRAAISLNERFGCAALVKGGHDPADPTRDALCIDGKVWDLASPEIDSPLSTHGTGCTLSAAIAAALARGETLLEAVALGKACIYEALRTCAMVGPDIAVLGLPATLPRNLIDVAFAN